jgi:hypothetical protein
MISITHLIWIIPLCVCIGVLLTAFIVGASTNNKYQEIYDIGVEHGMNLMKYKYEIKNDLVSKGENND